MNGNGAALLSAAAFDGGLAVFHLTFWPVLGWPDRLRASGEINAAVTQTLNLVLIFVFAAFALALAAGAVAARPIDPLVPATGAGFWILRTALQPILFPARTPWLVSLAAVFAFGAAVHLWASLG